MRLSEITRKAKSVGLKDTWKYSKKDLIKAIQRKEGNFDCFGTVITGQCNQNGCCWRVDCVR